MEGGVDVGCGKGQVLLLAPLFDFDEILPLEVSPALTEITGRNAERFSTQCPHSRPLLFKAEVSN